MMMASYSNTQMRRLMQTIIALASGASARTSKCFDAYFQARLWQNGIAGDDWDDWGAEFNALVEARASDGIVSLGGVARTWEFGACKRLAASVLEWRPYRKA